MFTSCGRCEEPIGVNNILKFTPLPNVHGYLAVLWQCPSCTLEAKSAIPKAEFDAAKKAWAEKAHVDEIFVTEFAKDLDVLVEDAGDLFTIWASYGRPPRVEVMPGRGCSCPSCTSRRRVGVSVVGGS